MKERFKYVEVSVAKRNEDILLQNQFDMIIKKILFKERSDTNDRTN